MFSREQVEMAHMNRINNSDNTYDPGELNCDGATQLPPD